MQQGEPSKSALAMAKLRAAHQVLDGGKALLDPYACAMAGVDPAAISKAGFGERKDLIRRLGTAMRSRFSEDTLGRAVEAGVRQAVSVGAGLETFGLRNPYADRGLKVFEVDHPATQSWKRDRIAEWQTSPPNLPIWVPADLERDDLAGVLSAAGFRRDRPAFFSLLGLVGYLERKTVRAVLEFIGTVPHSHAVFDYVVPIEHIRPELRDNTSRRRAHAAKVGEPVISEIDPESMHRMLGEVCLAVERDYDFLKLMAYFGWNVPGETSGGDSTLFMQPPQRRNPATVPQQTSQAAHQTTASSDFAGSNSGAINSQVWREALIV